MFGIQLSKANFRLYSLLTEWQTGNLREGLKKKPKTLSLSEQGGSKNYPLCLNPISEFLIWLLSINFISKWLNLTFVFSSMVCIGLLAWSKMYKYQHPKFSRNLGFCSNIPVVYNWTLPFWKCLSNITAFKVKKCSFRGFLKVNGERERKNVCLFLNWWFT